MPDASTHSASPVNWLLLPEEMQAKQCGMPWPSLIRAMSSPQLQCQQKEPTSPRPGHATCVSPSIWLYAKRGSQEAQTVYAVIRKLLHAIHAMLENQTPFGNRHFYAPTGTAAE